MSSDSVNNVLTYSNPVTASLQVVKQATGKDISPRISVSGVTLSPANLTSPQTAIMEVASVATQVETNRQMAVAEKQAKKDIAADKAEFAAFSAQEQSLLADPSTPVFTPKYRRSSGLAQQTEAMAQLFNARKQDVLSRSSMPGISQTRTR
jgi:hypothetical protein